MSHAGQPEAALESYHNVHRISPHYPHTFSNLVLLHSRMGQYDQARQACDQYAQLTGIDSAPELAMIDALEDPALTAQAVALIQESPDYPDGASGKAQIYMLLGEHELALRSLESAFEAGDPYAIHMNRFEYYDPIRNQPRFRALLEKMNLLP